jgi:hypothetical protein
MGGGKPDCGAIPGDMMVSFPGEDCASCSNLCSKPYRPSKPIWVFTPLSALYAIPRENSHEMLFSCLGRSVTYIPGQRRIAALIKESFVLRGESGRLLNEAKELVEREIEKG